MIDGEHVDPIFTNHVEDAIREAAERGSAYARMCFRTRLRVSLDAGEARIHGA
jgi:hypothetical protein